MLLPQPPPCPPTPGECMYLLAKYGTQLHLTYMCMHVLTPCFWLRYLSFHRYILICCWLTARCVLPRVCIHADTELHLLSRCSGRAGTPPPRTQRSGIEQNRKNIRELYSIATSQQTQDSARHRTRAAHSRPNRPNQSTSGPSMPAVSSPHAPRSRQRPPAKR